MNTLIRHPFSLLLLFLTLTLTPLLRAEAGIALGATRVIYPASSKQVQLSVMNSDEGSHFLIQSWVENATGEKDPRFVITPPLFLMKGKKESTLRIIDASQQALPQDRESLFWINVKAIPAMEKANQSANTLQFAIVNRIKLLYRPAGLKPAVDRAPEQLRFHRSGTTLTLHNPTPYYLTINELKAGNTLLPNALVPPMASVSVAVPAGATGPVTYRTINDYGALTPVMSATYQPN
ncbi:fimbria/pilus periplasmic chaperone [Pantoea sp. 1.19]|uniref:fimbria/pilus periplasmic chaperone n=1 Tax=Pantoea sp. 1.19 TaxID=1925589 RepID=UPI000948BEE7|nr:fimbria/pilus periplasmic chaperone [Pantoea sp. 1.19]